MSKLRLIGVERLDFTTKEGNKISGAKMHLTRPYTKDEEEKGCKGEVYFGSSFLSDTSNIPRPNTLITGNVYDFDFVQRDLNSKPKLAQITEVKKSDEKPAK